MICWHGRLSTEQQALTIFGSPCFNHTGVTMRGLAVTKDVPSGTVLEMPEDTILSLLNPKFTGGLKLPADGDHRAKHHGILATHRAIGKDSPFKEYIDSLPTT